MIDPKFTPPTETEEGAMLLAVDEEYAPAMLADSPPGVVVVYTQEGRLFSVLTGNHQIEEDM